MYNHFSVSIRTVTYLHYAISDDLILHAKVDGYPPAPLVLLCGNKLQANAKHATIISLGLGVDLITYH